jgi:N-acetylneuraminate synthase
MSGPFIICEAGVNWRDLVDADDMIREAAKAGADAVKFQCYKPDFHEGKPFKEALLKYHSRAAELNAIALDESTIRYLYWRCQQHGIEFMATPMFPEAVAMLDPYVKRWKVRFADRENYAILGPCRATGKPMLISGENMFCVSEYPPKDWPASLQFKKMAGYSCHIPIWEHAAFAVEHHNLEYLEVHVRLDRYEPHYCPIDVNVSITMSELAELCRRLKK